MKFKSFILLAVAIPSMAFGDASKDLLKAVKEHNIEGMKAAIAGGADVNTTDEGGNTPLNCAIWWPDEVKLLIDSKADVNQHYPLSSAALWGQTESVNILLKAGADVNAKNGLGQSALWSAAFGGNQVSVLSALMAAGANVDEGDLQGMTPLFTLSANGKTPAERVATIKSLAPNLEKAGLALPEQMKAPKESDYSSIGDMIKVLVDAKANVNVTLGKTGMTPLMWAAKNGKPDAIIALVKANADVNAEAKTGWTALCYAANNKGCTEAALALIGKGANVNVKLPWVSLRQKNGKAALGEPGLGGKDTKEGLKDVTILMLAAKEGDVTLVKALIAAKANVNAICTGGVALGDGYSATTKQTATTIAHSFEHEDVVAVLMGAGAKAIDDIE
jgi:ankyrin repeat protein